MSSLQPDQQISCTFCRISQEDAKNIIASSDKHAYICDVCTLEPSRLKLIPEKPDNQRIITSSVSTRVRKFFRGGGGGRGLATEGLRCSFCRKEKESDQPEFLVQEQ